MAKKSAVKAKGATKKKATKDVVKVQALPGDLDAAIQECDSVARSFMTQYRDRRQRLLNNVAVFQAQLAQLAVKHKREIAQENLERMHAEMRRKRECEELQQLFAAEKQQLVTMIRQMTQSVQTVKEPAVIIPEQEWFSMYEPMRNDQPAISEQEWYTLLEQTPGGYVG